MNTVQTGPIKLHHVGLQQQEVTLLESLCNTKPALLDPFVFCGGLEGSGRTDVLLLDADRPDAPEQLRRFRQNPPGRLVLVTTRDRQHRDYLTLKRPLSFASLRQALSPLASGENRAQQACG